MTKLLAYPEEPAIDTPAKKLVVFLHGVGSDGNDLISLVPFIQKELPFYHFISPHGVEAYDMAPFGRQWFSLIDRTPEIIKAQVKANAPLVANIIADKQKILGLTNHDTYIFGFSQGTMLGIYLTLTAKEPYAGMLAFSGRLIQPELLHNKSTPFCIVHGEQDSVVSVEESEKMAQYCNQHTIKYEKLIIPNLIHSIDASGLQFAVNFIKKYEKND